MQYNTKILALCALLSIIIHASKTEQISMEIDIGGRGDKCAKYTENGTDYLKITHTRIFVFDAEDKNKEKKIVGNYLCETDKAKATDKQKYSVKCRGQKTQVKTESYYVMVSVTTKQQMLSGSIDYRYNEGVMSLVKNGYLAPENLEKQEFLADKHLHLKEIRISGDIQLTFNMTNCHIQFPKRLISDHGLYTVGVINKEHVMWRMYYEPYGIGEYIVG